MGDDVISRVEEHLAKVGLSDESTIDNTVNEMTYGDLRELLALARSNRDAICAELETQAVECERFTLISGSKAAQRFRELLDRLPSPPDAGKPK